MLTQSQKIMLPYVASNVLKEVSTSENTSSTEIGDDKKQGYKSNKKTKSLEDSIFNDLQPK